MTGTLVLLRPAGAENAAYEDVAAAHGFELLVEPVLSIEPVEADFGVVADDATLIVTSAKAIDAFAAQDERRSMAVVAVGPNTGETAKAHGFTNVETGPGTARELPDFLLNKAHSRLIYLRGEDISTDIAEVMRQKGHDIAEIILYRSETAQNLSMKLLNALDARKIEAVCVFSARGGACFAELIEQYGRAPRFKIVKALCISDAVLKSVSVLPFQQALVAATPDRHGMLGLVERIAVNR